ncbi:unnamed protein product [Sphagnum jensenii]|uniref:Uncharacterized protein n=1 Tax=Sphagnum jensenii TaxID=128206 RepID=A0ABP1AV04_9BRYO
MAFGVYTGFRVTSQCFQYFPCPQSPEVLKALQDNFTPYLFSSFVVGCSWRLRELRLDGRTGTGWVILQCFQHLPCPPKPGSVESSKGESVESIAS